jgi:hypothetical protein
MKLEINDTGTGRKQEVIKLLNRYGELSNIFKTRLNAAWRVELKNGDPVDAHTDGEDITISIPPVLKEDTIREVVEAILFECGNASRASIFRTTKRKFLGLDTPTISMIEYGNQKATAEAENFWEYSKGLNDLKYNNFVLSFQGRKQLKDVDGISSQTNYTNKFKQSAHNPNSPDNVQRLPSVDMYAYELIRDTYELKLWKILHRVVTAGPNLHLFVDELLKKTTFNNMSKEDRIPSWCTIMDIINKTIALRPGCWVKAAGYDFTHKMLEVAVLETFSLVETKQAFNTQLTNIKGALGIGNEFVTPTWLI